LFEALGRENHQLSVLGEDNASELGIGKVQAEFVEIWKVEETGVGSVGV
jgi:hypothetical protein